jgi:hypothetical protein
MRGTVAKRLREIARQKASVEQPKMAWFKRMLPRSLWKVEDRPAYVRVGTLEHRGYRRVYQNMKKAHKSNGM